jgi:hypothetical protein
MFEKMKFGQRCLVQSAKELEVLRSIHLDIGIQYKDEAYPVVVSGSVTRMVDIYVAEAGARPKDYDYIIPPVDPIPDGYEAVFDASTPRSKGMQYFSNAVKKWRDIDFGSHNVKLFQDEYYIKPKEKTEPEPVQEDLVPAWQSGEFKKIKSGQVVRIGSIAESALFDAINPECPSGGFSVPSILVARASGMYMHSLSGDVELTYKLPGIAPIPSGYEPVFNNSHHPYVPGMMYWSNASRKWEQSFSPSGPLVCLYYIKPKTQPETTKEDPQATEVTEGQIKTAEKKLEKWVDEMQKKVNNDFWVDADTANKLCGGSWTATGPWPIGNGPAEYDKMNPMMTPAGWSNQDRMQEIKEVIQLAMENLQ